MITIRERAGKHQALVRIKQGGKIVFNKARTFDEYRLANDWAKRLEAQLKRDGVMSHLRTSMRLSDLITKYIAKRAEIKPLGRATLADLDLLDRELGAMPLNTLTSKVWADFASRRKTTAGPATILHNLSTARTLLKAAKPVFGIEVNADSVVECIGALSMYGHVSRSKSRDRRPTADEIEALLREFDRIKDYPQTQIRMRDVVQIALALPRRLGELCSMQWVDYDGRIITLRDTKHPRTPRTEAVPVPAKARKVIDELPRFDACILPYKPDSVSAAFERACDRLGIEDLRFHDLRHEGICRLFEAGLQIPEVAMISGHQSWQNLKRYTHLRPEAVLERLDATK